jgi:hypothetical protein
VAAVFEVIPEVGGDVAVVLNHQDSHHLVLQGQAALLLVAGVAARGG